MENNRIVIFSVGSCIVLVILFLYFFYLSPEENLGAKQPIPFSHQVHAGVKAIPCQFCHPYVDRSTFPGIPPVEKCFYCHKYIISNHPEVRKEHKYLETMTPVPWIKVNYVPETTFFKHQCHIRKGVACAECHGQIETMDRIKGIRFEMGFCVTCHRQRKVNLDCWLACHN